MHYCASGGLAEIKGLELAPLETIRDLGFSVDEEGRNGLYLAFLHGHWELGLFLLRELKVSPYKKTNSRENIYHAYARGLSTGPPSESDIQPLKDKNIPIWEELIHDKRNECEKIKSENRFTEEIELSNILPRTEDYVQELFGDPSLTIPKYIMLKHKASIKQANADGQTPDVLALSLGHQDLGDFYAQQTQASSMLRRMLQGLNEDLIKKIMSFF